MVTLTGLLYLRAKVSQNLELHMGLHLANLLFLFRELVLQLLGFFHLYWTCPFMQSKEDYFRCLFVFYVKKQALYRFNIIAREPKV